MKFLRPMISSGVVAVLWVTSASAAEQTKFRPYVLAAELTCPEGSNAVVEETVRGTVETCRDLGGQLNGYYLLWHKDGSGWAVLGNYQDDHRSGRWVTFLADGRPAEVAYYRAGQVYYPWEEESDKPSMLARIP